MLEVLCHSIVNKVYQRQRTFGNEVNYRAYLSPRLRCQFAGLKVKARTKVEPRYATIKLLALVVLIFDTSFRAKVYSCCKHGGNVPGFIR